jgi:hypothetical protein
MFGILFPKFFWPTVRKNFWNLRLKAKNIAKILRLLKYGSEEKGSSTF